MAHIINIDNINEGETITYSTVLLKGSVISRDNTCSLPDEITINSTPYKLFDGNFRCLVELEVDENTIHIQYCCTERIAKLFYTPRRTERVVRPLYIILNGHNGCFQAPDDESSLPDSACTRIDICCKLLQTVLAEKLRELDFGRKTFMCEPCTIFKSQLSYLDARDLRASELWEYLAREILNSTIASDEYKYLAFICSTWYNGERYKENMTRHEEFIKITDTYVALGGGNLAIFGTACLYTWPETFGEILERFQDARIVDKTKFLDDSAYRGTRGACFATTLGSVLHELCHTFDLAHTKTGIMGRGFDHIQNMFLINAANEHKPSTITVPSSRSEEDPISIIIKEADRKSFIRRFEFPDEVLNRTISIDDIFFTKSSACILAYHKWLNDYPHLEKFILIYDKSCRLVKSTQGIRVVEIRRGDDENVEANWVFTGKILKYSFQSDEFTMHDECEQKVTIFVEDNAGNILKERLSN